MKKRLFGTLALIGAIAVPMTASAYVLGPTTPGKWGSAVMGTGATVTWSYMNSGVSCAAESAGCLISSFASFMPPGFGAQVQNAFDAWSAVANLTFVFVAADNGVAFDAPGTNADIRIGGHAFDGPNGVLAHGFYPPDNGASAAGDIHFDTTESWDLNQAGAGIDLFTVMAHELGHALGLDHTSVPNSLMNAIYSEAFVGLQSDDVAGMQFIYGAPVSTNVPEPATLALVGLALVGMSLRRRSAAR